MVPLFTTSRLLVRQLNEDDFAGFYRLQSDPEVMAPTGAKPQHCDECRDDLLRRIQAYDDLPGVFQVFAVDIKETASFLGTCAFIHERPAGSPAEVPAGLFPDISGGPVIEIGYRLLATHWAQGFGTELSKGMLHYAFSRFEAGAVRAVAFRDNVASVKILSRLMPDKAEYYNDGFGTWDVAFSIHRAQWSPLPGAG